MKSSLAAVAIALLLALSACGDDLPTEIEPPTPETTVEAEPTDTSTQESPAELTVGGPYTLNVTTDLATYDYDVQAVKARTVEGEDYTFEVVEFTVTISVHEGELQFIGGWSIAQTPLLIGPDGTEYEQATYAAPDQFDGTITEGETATGPIGFEAPASAVESGVYRLELLGYDGSESHEWSF